MPSRRAGSLYDEPVSDVQPRPICPACQLPARVCVCPLTRVTSRHRVLILQHPREHGRTINTARLVPRVMPAARLAVGARFDAARLAPLLTPPAVLVYPCEDAVGAASLADGPPVTIVMVDGTWSTARTLLRDSPGLHGLPRVGLLPTAPSRYALRSQPSPEYLCTLEALATVLRAAGEPGVAEALERPFDRLMEIHRALRDVNPRQIRGLRERQEPVG